MNIDFYNRIVAGEALTRVLAGQSLWQLTGPDRTRYLNGQVTLDIEALGDGTARLAAVCTAKGRMEGAVTIAAHGETFYLDADPSLRDTLGPRLEKYLIADDAAFEDISDSWSLSHVFGATPPTAPAGGFVVRHSRFGVAGHDVWTPSQQATVVGDVVEEDVAETLRLEHAIPRWDAELTAQTLPPEAGPVMLDAISYTKGCYVGQETIARLKSVGHVNRTLVLLRSANADPIAPGTKLSVDEKEIGVVTSRGFSPRFGVAVALAYVPLARAVEGTVLQAAGNPLTVAKPVAIDS